ncbi:MAG: hypothetical protein E7291_03460 [Lachnospiraceae bacterium]|nr:hypothetical protein [Lachnospiraceae bacterium]
MRKNHSSEQQSTLLHNIPDIDIIDLENDGLDNDELINSKRDIDELDIDRLDNDSAEKTRDDVSTQKRLRAFFNPHILFAVAIVGIVVFVAVRLLNWGETVDLAEIFKDGQGTYDNSLDSILPLVDQQGQIVETNNDTSVIVAFGNAPFADDRDSKDNLCNIIADNTGATVYNCSVSGSYLASQSYIYDANVAPMDAFCFYWLAALAAGEPLDGFYESAEAAMGDDYPPEAREVYETIKSLDFNEVNVITIMYDATDYLLGHEMYNDANAQDITQFTGNLEAGISLLRACYPHIRIIVMSPTYAYAVDEDGNYVSSDMYTYGQDVLSTYSIKQYGSCSRHSVSFVDHLYGTITEDNASEYLVDNLHLNVKGRQLVAERFEYFLNYYNK